MIMQLSMSIGVTIAGLLLGLFGSQHVSVDSGTTQTVFMYTWLSMASIIALPAFIFARVPNDTHQNVAISRRKKERAMKFWRPGITGKLFLAIFATCIVLLITMHWAVRISFERGFIDYIKHGNEQRLQMLGDALGEQYAQHGNWRFLRNNDRFCISRSYVHWSMITTKISPAPVCRHTAGAHNFGWLIKTTKCWLAREHQFHPTAHGVPLWSMVRKLAR